MGYETQLCIAINEPSYVKKHVKATPEELATLAKFGYDYRNDAKDQIDYEDLYELSSKQIQNVIWDKLRSDDKYVCPYGLAGVDEDMEVRWLPAQELVELVEAKGDYEHLLNFLRSVVIIENGTPNVMIIAYFSY